MVVAGELGDMENSVYGEKLDMMLPVPGEAIKGVSNAMVAAQEVVKR